jgi:hypothetical protein
MRDAEIVMSVPASKNEGSQRSTRQIGIAPKDENRRANCRSWNTVA